MIIRKSVIVSKFVVTYLERYSWAFQQLWQHRMMRAIRLQALSAHDRGVRCMMEGRQSATWKSLSLTKECHQSATVKRLRLETDTTQCALYYYCYNSTHYKRTTVRACRQLCHTLLPLTSFLRSGTNPALADPALTALLASLASYHSYAIHTVKLLH